MHVLDIMHALRQVSNPLNSAALGTVVPAAMMTILERQALLNAVTAAALLR